MADEELEALRQQRLAELQAKHGVRRGGSRPAAVLPPPLPGSATVPCRRAGGGGRALGGACPSARASWGGRSGHGGEEGTRREEASPGIKAPAGARGWGEAGKRSDRARGFLLETSPSAASVTGARRGRGVRTGRAPPQAFFSSLLSSPAAGAVSAFRAPWACLLLPALGALAAALEGSAHNPSLLHHLFPCHSQF